MELKEASVLPYQSELWAIPNLDPPGAFHFRCKCAWNGHVVVKNGIAKCPGCGAEFTVELPERSE